MSDQPKVSSAAVAFTCLFATFAVGVLILLIVKYATPATQPKLIETLLNWPVLGFVTLMIIFSILGSQLFTMLANSNIKIAGLIEIDREVKDVTSTTDEEVVKLKARLDQIEKELKLEPPAETAPPAPDITALSGADNDAELYQSLVKNLESSKYTWRSLEMLGFETGVGDTDKIAAVLRQYGDGEVRMSKGKSGKPIARLISD